VNRRLTLALAAFGLLVGAAQLAAHDDKIHKATIGEVVSANANGLDLKTKDGIVKIKYSSKTTFELDKKPTDKASVKSRQWISVIGPKLPTGELMANEVILGVPAPNPAAEKKADHKH
jgi:hypothetical protein